MGTRACFIFRFYVSTLFVFRSRFEGYKFTTVKIVDIIEQIYIIVFETIQTSCYWHRKKMEDHLTIPKNIVHNFGGNTTVPVPVISPPPEKSEEEKKLFIKNKKKAIGAAYHMQAEVREMYMSNKSEEDVRYAFMNRYVDLFDHESALFHNALQGLLDEGMSKKVIDIYRKHEDYDTIVKKCRELSQEESRRVSQQYREAESKKRQKDFYK